MGSRGFTPRVAVSVAEGLAAIQTEAPAFAVIDLKLGDGTGLDVMKALKAKRPEAKAIILTGYGAIATAVVAVKLGAYDYLAKPVNADEIVAVLTARAQPARRRSRASDVGGPGFAGNTSSASMNPASATSRRRRASSTCIGAPCSAFSASARRAGPFRRRRNNHADQQMRVLTRVSAPQAGAASNSDRHDWHGACVTAPAGVGTVWCAVSRAGNERRGKRCQ